LGQTAAIAGPNCQAGGPPKTATLELP